MSNSPQVEIPIAPPQAGTAQTSALETALAPLCWEKPVLSDFGDVRALTMGTSPGTGESGNPATFRS